MPNNFRYPAFLQALLQGSVNLTTATLKAQLTDGYTPSATHDFLNDVSSGLRVDTPVTVTVISVTDGKVTVTVPDFTTVAAGPTVDGVVFYIDAATDATRRLAWFIGKKADGTLLAIVADGGDISLQWTGFVFSIGGS